MEVDSNGCRVTNVLRSKNQQSARAYQREERFTEEHQKIIEILLFAQNSELELRFRNI